MAFYDKFPYTNFHELNTDWIIQKIKHIDDSVEESAASAEASAASASASEESAQASAASAEASADSASASDQSAQDAAASAAGIEAARQQIYTNTARIDNILVEGTPTEGNAELIDIRVGANGETYPTAGDAVRGQYSALNQVLKSSAIEPISTTFVQGGINPTVVADVDRADRIRSDYIDFDTFSSAKVNDGFQLWYFCYNSAKTSIITYSSNNAKSVFKTNIQGSNIAYIRFTVVYENSTLPITPDVDTGFEAFKSIPEINRKDILNINTVLSSVSGWVKSNTDLNDYQTSGVYQFNMSAANYATVSNKPSNELLSEATGCLLQVIHTSTNTDEGMIYQRILNAFPNATQEKIRLIRIGIKTGNEMVWYPWRTEYYSAHKIDEIMEDIPKIFRVGSTREYTSLLEGIIAAEQYKNSIVYVDPGTYDAVQEFKDKYGIGYFTSANYTSQENFRGIPLKNGVHIIGYGGVVVTGGLESTDSAEAIEWWSIFNAGDDAGGTNGYGFTLENVTVKILNQYLRYAVHDEYGGVDFDYINKYINCHFIVPQDIIRYCIGGGLGKHGYIVIDGCTVDAPAYAETTRGINYHNNLDSGSLSEVYVKNSYIPNGTVGITWYGNTPATEKSTLYVNNCYLQHEPIKRAETASSEIENVDIVAWNNTIVSNS